MSFSQYYEISDIDDDSKTSTIENLPSFKLFNGVEYLAIV